MKVLWFSNTPAAGDVYISSNGTGGWMKSLDKAIQDKVDLHVVFYDRRYPKKFKVGNTTYYQIAPKDKFSLIKRRLLLMIGKNPDLPHYIDIISEVNPDIIHIHGTEKPWIQLSRYTDKPVILSIQAILTVMTYKYYSGLTKEDLPLMSSYKSDYKGYLKESFLEREYIKDIKYVLGRTDWDRRVYSILAPHAKYNVSNEILRDGFYSARWIPPKREGKRIIIHTTTGCLLFKGLETICAAVNELIKLGIELDWRVAGIDDNSEVVKAVKRKMSGNYPSKGLNLLGSLCENKLIEKMLEADIYVNASHQDNSPNSLCEAMLLGMPCIATCAGGTSTILRDKETGILVQDGDPWVLAGAILELVNDFEKAKVYAETARSESLKRHDKDSIVNNLVSIYQQIVLSNR